MKRRRKGNEKRERERKREGRNEIFDEKLCEA